MRIRGLLRKMSDEGMDAHDDSGRLRLFPWLGSLRGYGREPLGKDARAAVNVTLLALPQAMAYAAIAGLPIIYGLMCAAVAAVVAPFFSASRHTIIGPTNATAFMLFSFFSTVPALGENAAAWTSVIGVLIGVMAILGGLLRLADLLQFISRSVLVGYLSGAALLIMAAQSVTLFGLEGFFQGRSKGSMADIVIGLVQGFRLTEWQPLLIGLSTIAGFYILRALRPRWPVFALTLLGSATVFGTLIALEVPAFSGVRTFEAFGVGQLAPRLPDFQSVDLFGHLPTMLGIAFAVTFVASLENTLMAKTLASRTGDSANANQDMLGLGMANMASALSGGMPASGSLNRSMLNYDSGAATRWASLLGGLYTLAFAVGIALLADQGLAVVRYVPKAVLAGMVIIVSFSLFNLRHIKICLRSTPDDAKVMAISFMATLLAPLHIAIFIGVAVSIALFLRKASKPLLAEYEFNEVGELREKGDDQARMIPAISIVHVEGDLFFGAAELFRTQIQRTVSDPSLKVIILRLKNARHLDATAVMALEDLIHFMRKKNLHLLVSGATEEVHRVLRLSGILNTLQQGCDLEMGESNVFLSSPTNPNISTRDALKRAQQLLGTDKADIRIFFDPHKKQG